MTGPAAPRLAGRDAAGLLLGCLVLLLGLACGQPRRGPSLPVQARASRVDVFVAASTGVARGISFELAGLRLVDALGTQVELPVTLGVIASDELARRTAVAGGVVPPGTYVALQLELARAAKWIDGQRVPLPLLPFGEPAPDAPQPEQAAEPIGYSFPVRLEVGRHDAASLFLEWDVDASLLPGGWFRPALGLNLQTPTARLGLLYVSDAASGSVLALNRASGQVVATIKVGDEPRALALARNRRQLFVANAGDGSLSLVDTREYATQFTIPVRFGARTSDIVEADPGRLVAVVNSGLDTVSLFDVRNASKLGDLRVGRGPTRLAAAPELRRLFVVDTLSDDVSVIDLSALSVVTSIPVESRPSAIAVDRREREVFIGHRDSPELFVIDAKSLLVVETIFVGRDVTAVLADRIRDRIYVSRSSPPELLVVDRRLAAVTRRIPVSGSIAHLAQPPEGPSVYGAAPELGGLIVVDVITGREQPLLPCGTTPSDVAAID